jgi:tetraacyldisaccharide 4'-kinase
VGERAPVPVIGIGGATVGGSGKTPVARAVAGLLRELGATPHVVLRGHGGSARGPLRVEPGAHDHRLVGDEALLHAADGATWVARCRVDGARAAAAAGATHVVLDDGLQHHAIRRDLSLLVVDAAFGIGNGRLLPAGPLRETLPDAAARADAAVLVGEDRSEIGRLLPPALSVFAARLEPRADAAELAGRPVLAFAGLARPERLQTMLARLGARVARFVAFGDHHRYSEREIARLAAEAERRELTLVTSAKDAVRLPAAWRHAVRVVEVALAWQDPRRVREMLIQWVTDVTSNSDRPG